ncbi:putative tRNA-dihydrouridine synthase [Candidatus Terasakiella magnetica]|uniref:tRNA-dihydrouridine synthase n=1 Tax=Candidatus Terasakiella magnetica TaxID=1867952 RepID=A0A1C3RD22_9PROT|nr:tRNA dihydrouridine synthase DusB [Candidatus Terasakiella magnetica]SCA55165.1 putative tRNA-dihydrouridine synthase [Candidatus Terasakiella magnetica]
MIKNKALKISTIELESPVVLAPMSGVTDMPFRKLVKQFGAGLVVSEMIASQEMLRASTKTQKMATPCEDESPIAVQLAGTDPEIMAQAAIMNEARGADIIDINMGCPVKKIVKSFAGSALMRNEKLAGEIMQAVKAAVNIPVTVKMRLGWDEESLNGATLAKMAEDIGLSAITIHGRTRNQMYGGHANWEAIAPIKQAVNIPVIGNGDLNTLEDVDKMIEQSGVDGVMVGRGAYGRPWFLRQVMDYLKTGEQTEPPSLAEQCEIVLEHYQAMLEHYGEHVGVRHARKHIGWYCKGLNGATNFRNEIMKMASPDEVKTHIRDFYTANIERKVA